MNMDAKTFTIAENVFSKCVAYKCQHGDHACNAKCMDLALGRDPRKENFSMPEYGIKHGWSKKPDMLIVALVVVLLALIVALVYSSKK